MQGQLIWKMVMGTAIAHKSHWNKTFYRGFFSHWYWFPILKSKAIFFLVFATLFPVHLPYPLSPLTDSICPELLWQYTLWHSSVFYKMPFFYHSFPLTKMYWFVSNFLRIWWMVKIDKLIRLANVLSTLSN